MAAERESGGAPTAPARRRILLAEEDAAFRAKLGSLIDRQNDLVCCGQVGSAVEVQQAVEALQPEVLVLNPAPDFAADIELIWRLKARFRELQILVFTELDEMLCGEDVLGAGASGFLVKGQAGEEALDAIRTVLSAQLYVSPKLALLAFHRLLQAQDQHSVGETPFLTGSELSVFLGMGLRKSNEQLAAELKLSLQAIASCEQDLLDKLRVGTAAELTQAAARWVREEPQTVAPLVAPAETARTPLEEAIAR